jgi:ATP-binding cassette subfamily G (WHITE) protein 2 (PDR)
MIFFLFVYLLATELNASAASTAEVLVFRRGHVPKHIQNAVKDTPNNGSDSASSPAAHAELDRAQDKDVNFIPVQHNIFTWRNVIYDISIKGNPRRLLDHVSGWVKPGTLTALMVYPMSLFTHVVMPGDLLRHWLRVSPAQERLPC